MLLISNLIIPLSFAGIICFGYTKKLDVYETFIEGAKDGFTTILQIMPTLVGLMVAVGILRASGFFEILSAIIAPAAELAGYPTAVVPLTLMRLVSSSASTGMLLDIFKQYGPDSYIGRFVSVMMSCTETVFYTLSIYFMSVKIEKTRYTLHAALLANLAGIIASLWVTELVFGK